MLRIRRYKNASKEDRGIRDHYGFCLSQLVKCGRTDGKSTVRIAYPFAQPKLRWLTPTLQKLVDTYLLADWMAQRG